MTGQQEARSGTFSPDGAYTCAGWYRSPSGALYRVVDIVGRAYYIPVQEDIGKAG